MVQRRSLLLLGIVTFALAIRVFPYALERLGLAVTTPSLSFYPWNLSPLTAVSLFGGTYFSDRRLAFGVPLIVLALSDVAIGLLRGDVGFTLHVGSPFVYGCFLLSVCMGFWLKKHRSPLAIAGTAMLAECVFFVVTNFGHWALNDMYPHTLAGLNLCYLEALPFFKQSLIGTALYVPIFYGAIELAERRFPELRMAPASR